MSIKQTIRVNLYLIVSEAVEEGINYGYNKAFKHTDNPDADLIKDKIYDALMERLGDIIQFDDPETDNLRQQDKT